MGNTLDLRIFHIDLEWEFVSPRGCRKFGPVRRFEPPHAIAAIIEHDAAMVLAIDSNA